jgi:hypothetical protein
LAEKRWAVQTDPGAAGDEGDFVLFSVHKRFLFSLWFVLFVVISTAFGGRITKWSFRLMSVLNHPYRYRTSAVLLSARGAFLCGSKRPSENTSFGG